MEFKRIADLDCLIQEGHPGAPTFLILHGYGASFEDLAPLANYINGPEGSTWIFANGPLEVPIGPMMTGRAWFPIDMIELEKAQRTGEPRIYADKIPPGYTEASEKVLNLIKELDVAYEDLYIGGFSQGAMISTDVTMQLERNPRGLILWSGAFVSEDRWTEKIKNRKGLRVFQSHGTADPLLPFTESQRLHQFMKDNELIAEFHEFHGGHEIPPQVIQKLNNFLIEPKQ